MLTKKYKCEKCGEVFSFSRGKRLINGITKLFVMMDPAPSIADLFASPSCPKCGSKEVKRIN